MTNLRRVPLSRAKKDLLSRGKSEKISWISFEKGYTTPENFTTSLT